MDTNIYAENTYIESTCLKEVDNNYLWTLYLVIIIFYGLIIASIISGLNSVWYSQLVKINVNLNVIGILLIVVTIIAYIGIFVRWGDNKRLADIPRIPVLYFISTLFLLAWIVSLFQGNDLALSTWLCAISFIYYLWFVIYVLNNNSSAAILMFPLLLLYGYFFYLMVHLVSVNSVPV